MVVKQKWSPNINDRQTNMIVGGLEDFLNNKNEKEISDTIIRLTIFSSILSIITAVIIF